MWFYASLLSNLLTGITWNGWPEWNSWPGSSGICSRLVYFLQCGRYHIKRDKIMGLRFGVPDYPNTMPSLGLLSRGTHRILTGFYSTRKSIAQNTYQIVIFNRIWKFPLRFVQHIWGSTTCSRKAILSSVIVEKEVMESLYVGVDVLLLRSDGAIFFANGPHLDQNIQTIITNFTPPVLALHLYAGPCMEYTALMILTRLEEQFAKL